MSPVANRESDCPSVGAPDEAISVAERRRSVAGGRYHSPSRGMLGLAVTEIDSALLDIAKADPVWLGWSED